MTTTAIELTEIEKLVDKESELTLLAEDGTTSKVVGTVKAASAAGVAFKPKGQSSVKLLELREILAGEAAPEKPKPITQSKQKPVPEGQMRRHLATYHGISLKWCREATEEQAVEFHNGVDHSDLGHKHVAEEEKKEEAPAEAASTEQTPGEPAEY